MSSADPAEVLVDGHRPVLVAAFDGWADSSGCATEALARLAELGETEPLATLDVDDFHDYQVTRPVIAGTGSQRRIEFPGAHLLRTVIRGRELLLLRAPEPSHRWRAYAEALLALVEPHRPGSFVLLESHLATTPHSRPVAVQRLSQDPRLQAARGVDAPIYEGPVGVGSVVADAAQRSGTPVLGLWAMVPQYVAADPYLSGALALVTDLLDVLDIRADLGDLEDEVRDERVAQDAELEGDPDLVEYVGELEARWDAARTEGGIAEAVERFLRRLP